LPCARYAMANPMRGLVVVEAENPVKCNALAGSRI